MDRIAYPLPEAARVAGVSRTRIFEAVRKEELTIRKAGRASIVTHDALMDWINSLPVKGKQPIGAAAYNTVVAAQGGASQPDRPPKF